MAFGDAAASVTYHGRKCVVWSMGVGSEPTSKQRDKWINIAHVGTWKGHGAGEFEFTPAVFSQLITNFKARKTPVDIDYDHKSRRSDSMEPARSAGYISRLETRNGGKELWALCRLTELAAEMVANEEMRGCSPVVAFDATDRASGKPIGPELLQLALTNNPFLDGLKGFEDVHEMSMVTAMSDATDAEKKKKEDAADGGVDDATENPDGSKKPVAMADAAANGGASVDASSLITAISDACGVSADAVLGILMDKIDAVTKLVSDNAGDGTVADGKPMSAGAACDPNTKQMTASTQLEQKIVELTKINESLSKRVVTLNDRLDKQEQATVAAEKKAKEDAIAVRVDGMVKSLAITADERDGAIYMFTHNPTLAEKTYGGRKALIGTTQAGDDPVRNGTQSVTVDHLTEAERATVVMLTASGNARSEDEALEMVGLTRDGKTSPVEAARKVAAKRGAKG